MVKRHAEESVRLALTDTRIVSILGPRQSGKTTLALRIANEDDRTFVSLDDDQYRQFAQEDLLGFVRSLETAVIDEIQRAPNLILALKQEVDLNSRAGRFLFTGSVDLFRGSLSPDSLAGRIETIELLPFSQAEINAAGTPGFIDRGFANDFAYIEETGPTSGMIEQVLAGGFPEALVRSVPSRCRSWLRSYAKALAGSDVSDIAAIDKREEMARLIDHAALSAGQLLNMSKLGTHLGVDGKTADRWLVLLEQMFLIRRIPAWHDSQLKRLVKAPKLNFLDSGLLAALLGADVAALKRDRQKLGPLLESFVYSEVAKAIALSDKRTSVSHYRDKDGVEVDLVLERSPGAVMGIEVKAAATAHPRYFKGLKRLRDACGDRFSCGILLHDGDRIQQFAPKLYAMPFRMLWEG